MYQLLDIIPSNKPVVSMQYVCPSTHISHLLTCCCAARWVLSQVLDWFSRFGYQIPFGVSIADYILDISLGEAGYSNTGNTGPAAIKELYSAFEAQFGGAASVGNKAMQAGGFSSSNTSSTSGSKLQQPQGALGIQAGRSTQALPLSTIYSVGDLEKDQDGGKGRGVGQQVFAAGSSKQHRKPDKGRAPYWEQLRVLLQRTARVRRFEQMTGQHFFQLFAVAFITGGCVGMRSAAATCRACWWFNACSVHVEHCATRMQEGGEDRVQGCLLLTQT